MKPTSRRNFVAALPAVGLGAHSALTARTEEAAPTEAWLTAIAGRHHRQIFDVPVCHPQADALRRAANFLDVFNTDYAEPLTQLGAIFGAHGNGLGYILDDGAWERWSLSARFLPAARQVTVNPYRVQRPGSGWTTDYSVTTLQAKGVIFIACERSLRRLARDIADALPVVAGFPTGAAAAAASAAAAAADILAELRKHILPGVEVVPAMVVALCRAQEERIAYMHLG